MLILEANKIKKYFGERLILDFDGLKIYEDDKIGVVGLNGAGKTTLFNLLSGELQPDEGYVKLYGTFEYITQFPRECELQTPDSAGSYADDMYSLSDKLEIPSFLSGGEKTAIKNNHAFNSPSHILLADEPTSNLDLYAIGELQKRLCEYHGAILLISHDRGLLNKVCNKILEVENGGIKIYEGNYEKYRRQKDMELERMELDYEEAVSERKRLLGTKQTAKERLDGMRQTPKRMGNSEARLHKNGIKGRKNQERFIKNIENRIEAVNSKIDELPRRQEVKRVKIDVSESRKLVSKNALMAKGLDVYAGETKILSDVSFTIRTGSKTAILGANGSGKTTLIKTLLGNTDGAELAKSARTAYFAQDLSILEDNESIINNVSEGSVRNGAEIRTVLARLGFRGDNVFKKVSILSGGEKVKVSLAKIFAADVNLLILDEPTNYLDIYAAESLQSMMSEYTGTIVLVTHDRELIRAVADYLLIIKDGGVISFDGGLEEYEASLLRKKEKPSAATSTQSIMALENRLAYVTGRLAVKSSGDDLEALDLEYREIVGRLRELKG